MASKIPAEVFPEKGCCPVAKIVHFTKGTCYDAPEGGAS